MEHGRDRLLLRRYDNAAAESFFATLKKELVHRRRYRDLVSARISINAYINCFYNSRRRHSALGYVSPMAFETMKAQQQPEAAGVHFLGGTPLAAYIEKRRPSFKGS